MEFDLNDKGDIGKNAPDFYISKVFLATVRNFNLLTHSFLTVFSQAT